MAEHDPHKRRFLLFSAARLTGVAIMGLGFAVAFSDLVRDGGFRQLGGLLIALGTIELVIVPLLLKRAWDRR
jgi:hypothetical protein